MIVKIIHVVVLAICVAATLGAWLPSPQGRPHERAQLSIPRDFLLQQQNPLLFQRKQQSVKLHAFGGFGGGDKKKKKETKLKPKQQWDRFLDLKKEQKIRVSVRVSDDDEWLEVGNVKSKDNKYTEYAVARQRALIAEHARRLFPLQISPKDAVTCAYWNEETNQWTVIDKEIVDKSKKESPSLEKLIGFEGRPDPSSGFYCVYNEGRLVNDGDDARPSSKKLK